MKEIFPQLCKYARTIPILKIDNSSHINNNTPITLFLSFSKFFERLVFDIMTSFLTVNNGLFHNMFGFLAGKSTSGATFKLTKEITNALDKTE